MKKITLILALIITGIVAQAQVIKLEAYEFTQGNLDRHGLWKKNKNRHSGEADYDYVINLKDSTIIERSVMEDYNNAYKITRKDPKKSEDGSDIYWLKDKDGKRWYMAIADDLSYIEFRRKKSFFHEELTWIIGVNDITERTINL